ncbi:MAG: helix-turn-helix transcriptional regulator [Pseudomonadota bacterium]
MPASTGSREWQAAVARLIAEDGPDGLSDALIRVIDQVVDHSRVAMLGFSHDAPPVVLAHDLAPAEEKHYLQRYIAGPYLLDPLYQLALKLDKPSHVRFREATPDRFRSSEYYRQYCERTHLEDELDFFLDLDGATLVLVVAKLSGRFSKADIARLVDAEPIFHAAMRKLWERSDDGSRDASALSMHEHLTNCFRNFGASTLTQREREITQLLLRGHSTKSIARELDIAPGTVMVHKRNLFAKLGITSQYELFSRFIDTLSTP